MGKFPLEALGEHVHAKRLGFLARSTLLEGDFFLLVPSRMENVSWVLAPYLFLDLVKLARAIPSALDIFRPSFLLLLSELISRSSVLWATGPNNFARTQPISDILDSQAPVAFGLSIKLTHFEGNSLRLGRVSAVFA